MQLSLSRFSQGHVCPFALARVYLKSEDGGGLEVRALRSRRAPKNAMRSAPLFIAGVLVCVLATSVVAAEEDEAEGDWDKVAHIIIILSAHYDTTYVEIMYILYLP